MTTPPTTSPSSDWETLPACTLCGSAAIGPRYSAVDIWQCRDCGLLFDNPRPTVAAIAAHYSRAETYESRLGDEAGEDRLSTRQLKRVLRFTRGGRLLDVGAGIGQCLHQAAAHFSVAGTEVSRSGIDIAREKYQLELRHGTLEELSFGDERFDVVVLSQVLEHVPCPGTTLDRIDSLLKPGGHLYLAVPNEPPYSLRLLVPALLARLGVSKYRDFDPSGHRKIALGTMAEIHISHFTAPVLTRALTRRGFRILTCQPDFQDALMFSRKWYVQLCRHAAFGAALLLQRLFGLSVYNCFWLMARKES